MDLLSRFPRGKRGLKSGKRTMVSKHRCRFPRGKRGLKSSTTPVIPPKIESLPPREAWIEIPL